MVSAGVSKTMMSRSMYTPTRIYPHSAYIYSSSMRILPAVYIYLYQQKYTAMMYMYIPIRLYNTPITIYIARLYIHFQQYIYILSPAYADLHDVNVYSRWYIYTPCSIYILPET